MAQSKISTAPIESLTRFGGALAVPCKRHDAEPGQPCYSLPRGVCGRRVRALSRARYFDPDRPHPAVKVSKATMRIIEQQKAKCAERAQQRRDNDKRRGTRRAA